MAIGAGMNDTNESDPRQVVLNPYSNIPEKNKQFVVKNERLRHFMDETDPDLDFKPTAEQIAFFKGTEYGKPENEKYLKQTIIARIITGDESAGKITKEQQKAADKIEKNYKSTGSNVVMSSFSINGREVMIPTMVNGKKLTNKEALEVARKHGIKNYPSFATVEEANAFAEKNHGNIDEDGYLINK